MKRILFIVPVLVVLGWAAGAGAEAGGRMIADEDAGTLVVDSAAKFIEMVFPNPGSENFPSYFTFYSNDATAFWIQRRFAEGLRDTVPLPIPAGRSIKIPAPPPVLDADGENWRVTIFVGGHTDTVYALDWYE